MSESPIETWERGFRAAAKADHFAILTDYLQRLGLPDSPELLLEGTICAMRACSHLSDGVRFQQLLDMQRYNPVDSTVGRYAFTFDLCGKAFVRILVEPKFQTLDLADLYANPWEDYEVVGFTRVWISRIDWSELTGEELKQLEDDVTNDLRYDYSEDELGFWFDDSLDETLLFVYVYDMEDEDQE